METRREKGKFYAADKEICHNDNTIILCTESSISAQFSGVVVKKGNNSTFGEFSHKWNTNHFDIEVDFLNQNTTSQQQTIERLYNSVVNVKNPYSREKQYQQWAAAENVLDTIIRSAPFQEVKQLLNTTEPIDQ